MSRKLLLADDSITIQRVIELTFSGEDIDVVSVGDGEQAIEHMRSERPDIVLADIAMPRRGGYDVAAYMRSQPELATVPVLLLAGAFEPVDQGRAEAVQADGVLVKPFEPQQVVARVRELLRRGSSARLTMPPAAVKDVPPEPAASASEVTEVPVAVRAAAPTEPPAADHPAAERPEVIASAARPSPAAGAAVDEFFGRLGSAVASLGATRPPVPSAPTVSDDPWTYGDVPTVSGLLDQPNQWASHHVSDALVSDPESPADAFSMDGVVDDHRTLSGRTLRKEPPRNVIAEAFHALLAAEQGRPRPLDPVPVPYAPPVPAPAPTLVLTDELVDRITQRVLERLLPHAAREMVASIVSDVAERLVREELVRVKGRADTRS